MVVSIVMLIFLWIKCYRYCLVGFGVYVEVVIFIFIFIWVILIKFSRLSSFKNRGRYNFEGVGGIILKILLGRELGIYKYMGLIFEIEF